MARYARIQDKQVVEIIVPPEGVNINDCLHPDLVKTLMDVGDSAVDIGWGFDPENGGWILPAALANAQTE